MNALFNAHTHQGKNLSPHAGLIRAMLSGNGLYTKRFFRNEVNIKHKLNHCYNEKIIKLVSQAKLPV